MKRRQIVRQLMTTPAVLACWPAWSAPAPKPAGFPVRPLRIVVPFPPGGAADILARPLAQQLSQRIGQPVLIDNKPGANTVIGANHVATSAADGYTLLMGSEAGLSLAAELSHITKIEVPYRVERDFAPISLLGHYGSLMTINPEVPAKNLQEYIEYARKNPKKINFASFGLGSQPHIMMETLNQMAGIDTVHLPYKGVAPATNDLIAGHVQAMISAPSTPLPHVRDQKLRGLAYSGAKRLPELPNVPTFAEAGLPTFNPRGWFGLVMASATPEPIRAWLSENIWAVVQSSEYQINTILKNGYEIPSTEPSVMAEFMQEDRHYWKRMVDLIRHRLV